MRVGGVPSLPGGGKIAGGVGAGVPAGGAPVVRAYWAGPGGARGRSRGTAGGMTENADREEVESMRGIMIRIR
jgi:hypothetical protein